jgi:hypothetical protein
LIAVLVASTLLMSATNTVVDKGFGKLAEVYGAYTVAQILLAAALVALLRMAPESDADSLDASLSPKIAQPL